VSPHPASALVQQLSSGAYGLQVLMIAAIVSCKANPGKKVIEAIDVVFKEYRSQNNIKMKK
jgi:hypothetical protein